MLSTSSSPRVNDVFFQTLTGRVAASPHTRTCPEFTDEAWLHLGLQRVLAAAPQR